MEMKMAREIESEMLNLVGPWGIETPENKQVKLYLMQLTGNTGLEIQRENSSGLYPQTLGGIEINESGNCVNKGAQTS